MRMRRRFTRTDADRLAIGAETTGADRRRKFVKGLGNVDSEGPTGYCGPVVIVYVTTLGKGPSSMLMATASTEGHTGWADRGYFVFRVLIGRAWIIIVVRIICSRIGDSVAVVGLWTTLFRLAREPPTVGIQVIARAPALTSASAESCA